MKLREDPAKARREYDKLSDYDKLDHAYQDLAEAYGDRGRRIAQLERALKQIADDPNMSAGAIRSLVRHILKGTP